MQKVLTVLGKGEPTKIQTKPKNERKDEPHKDEDLNEGKEDRKEDDWEKDGQWEKEEQLKTDLLEQLRRLYEEQGISELDYYKLRVRAHERGQEFARKVLSRSGSINPEALRQMLGRGKGGDRYEGLRGRGEFGEFARDRTKKHEIPIIVRKYNNVIEKISTSYPLSVEQEQAVNLISELELKGLIS